MHWGEPSTALVQTESTICVLFFPLCFRLIGPAAPASPSPLLSVETTECFCVCPRPVPFVLHSIPFCSPLWSVLEEVTPAGCFPGFQVSWPPAYWPIEGTGGRLEERPGYFSPTYTPQAASLLFLCGPSIFGCLWFLCPGNLLQLTFDLGVEVAFCCR